MLSYVEYVSCNYLVQLERKKNLTKNGQVISKIYLLQVVCLIGGLRLCTSCPFCWIAPYSLKRSLPFILLLTISSFLVLQPPFITCMTWYHRLGFTLFPNTINLLLIAFVFLIFIYYKYSSLEVNSYFFSKIWCMVNISLIKKS